MSKRLVIALAAAACFGSGSGVAYAFVTSTGSGGGGASSTTMRAVTVDATLQDPAGAVLPGTTGDAAVGIDNPNSVPISVVSVVQNGTISINGAPGCTVANSGIAFANQTGLTMPVPAAATDYTIELPSAMSLGASAPNSCQNATFVIPVTITANQG